MEYSFTTKLWMYNGQGAWHFVTLPQDASADIKEVYGAVKAHGFGSVRVKVTIGTSTWQTSLFPESKSGCYVLPIKKAVRLQEAIQDQDIIQCKVVVL